VRILLLGANGQLGRALLQPLAALGEVVAATRDGRLADGRACLSADLADPVSLANGLETAAASVVVNAAAYTAVDRAEDEAQLAERINHHAVAEIASWCAVRRARLVHYSTDYVFDGRAHEPYREDDATGPLGVYGRTKLAGEDAVRASGCMHLILRTAWVYAAHGHNFLGTMLRLAAERDEVRVVADQVGTPTPARLIAATTAEVLARAPADPGHCDGTFHLTAAGHCSWYEFAAAIFAEAQAAGILERVPRVVPITTADYPTRARRPAWSVLDCQRLERRFRLHLPAWRDALREVVAEKVPC
jgi:dTDP-4-dehydrorhamnose reductase